MDPGDLTHKTLYAGTGNVSSLSEGEAAGILKTVDGGVSWELFGGELAVRDQTHPAHTDLSNGRASGIRPAEDGLYESTDGGHGKFQKIARGPAPHGDGVTTWRLIPISPSVLRGGRSCWNLPQ